MEAKLRIGNYLISYEVNGPGKRFVVWFQGCPFHCKGCLNPEFLEYDGGILMSVKEIMDHIRLAKETERIEGVTFTGGEPLIQAKALLSLARGVKSEDLTILCYTGYLLEDILNDKVPYTKELLKYIDILIDGPYIEEEKASLPWRGSRNQRVYFLTNKYKGLGALILRRNQRETELRIGKEGLAMTGIFDIKFWKVLKKKLQGKS